MKTIMRLTGKNVSFNYVHLTKFNSQVNPSQTIKEYSL